jgi:hypothetical protein
MTDGRADAGTVYDAMIEGIKTQNGLMLDNLGVIVNLADMPAHPLRVRLYLLTPKWLRWTQPKGARELALSEQRRDAWFMHQLMSTVNPSLTES